MQNNALIQQDTNSNVLRRCALPQYFDIRHDVKNDAGHCTGLYRHLGHQSVRPDARSGGGKLFIKISPALETISFVYASYAEKIKTERVWNQNISDGIKRIMNAGHKTGGNVSNGE